MTGRDLFSCLYLFLFLFLVSTLSPLLARAIDTQSSTQRKYDQAIQEANEKIFKLEEERFCPGVGLALTCGNGTCESDRAENEATCPQDCVNAKVKSYDSQVRCTEVQHLYVPKNIEEVQSAVHFAVANRLHVRAVGKAHSVNTMYCNQGVVISTEKLNQVIALERDNQGAETVLVEPGVTVGDLADWLSRQGKSLGYAVMGFRGMTVAGAIATGAHGSSPKHTAVISSLVKGVTLVDATGKLVEYSEGSSDPTVLRALRANLGMLGVVVRLRLAVSPQFNLHVKLTESSDHDLVKRRKAWKVISDCDFGQIFWFPSKGRMIKACGKETRRNPEKNAMSTLLKPEIPMGLVKPYQVALHYASCYRPLNALLEMIRYLMLIVQPPYMKENIFGNRVYTSNAIGLSHNMMSSGVTSIQKAIFQTDWELAVLHQYAQDALVEIAQYIQEHQIHLPLIGVFLRFAPSEGTTLLAHTVSEGAFRPNETAMLIEFPTPAPVGFSSEMTKALRQPYEDLAKLLVTKYHARGHWGKNDNWIFPLQNSLGAYGEHLHQFEVIRKRMDPTGTFTNEFSNTSGLSTQPEPHPSISFR